ncbi:MAG: NIPSNAP family protein [Pseudolabrys sp.]
MLIDHRTYTLRPGTIPAQLDLYGKHGFPVQLRYMGEPLCYLVAESGELNTLVHAWVYENAADRAAKRAAMAQDPDWKNYLKLTGEAGNIVAQRTSLLTPAPFAPPLSMPKIHK